MIPTRLCPILPTNCSDEQLKKKLTEKYCENDGSQRDLRSVRLERKWGREKLSVP